ncbi:MAG: GNAT family N-acetyltransferase [Flavobacteriales bacterium]
MELYYRVGTVEDIHQLQNLGLASYGPFKEVLTPDNWAKMYSFLAAEGSYTELLSKSTCFVCEHDHEIIGMAFLVPRGNPTEIFETDWSYIRMVGVSPHFRGNNIGRKLTQHCLDHAERTNETVVALHTSEFMGPARRMYEDLGFQEVRELDPRFGKRYWLYHFHTSN